MVATITRIVRWDPFALVERVEWHVNVEDGRRKIVRTRREAREWCAEMGIGVR